MMYKVKSLSYERQHKGDEPRYHIGELIYRHPKGCFVTLEFQGKIGKFRESFRPSELMKVSV